MIKWTVILEKGPRGEHRFLPESGHRAFDRAHALCELHGCQFTQDDKARTLTVHAGKYYARPNERANPYHERGVEDRNAPISEADAYAEGSPHIEDGRDNCNDAGTGEGRYHGRI